MKTSTAARLAFRTNGRTSLTKPVAPIACKLGIATLLAAALVLALTGLPAAASSSDPVTFFTDGQITEPGTVVGTWHSTGAVVDSGAYVEHYRLEGKGTITIHFEKTLVGARGTIVYDGNGIIVSPSPTEASWADGGWHVVSGTGSYGTLHAGGTPSASGTVDLTTGVVHARQEGSAHFDGFSN